MQVLFASLFLLNAGVSLGQEDKELVSILNEINSLYTSKIEEAVKKDQSRFNKMKAELEEIEKINESQGKKKAVENFSKNNKTAYGQLVREAGVNPVSVVARLKSKYPGYTFSVIEDYSILIERTGSESDPFDGTGSLTPQDYSPENGSTNEPDFFNAGAITGIKPFYPDHYGFQLACNDEPRRGPMPEADSGSGFGNPADWFSGITSTQELSFIQSKSVSCAAGSGGNVEFGARYARAWSTGVVAGDCSTSGRLENITALPATGVQAIRLVINIVSDVSGYAFGILGTSLTTAGSGFSVMNTATGQYASTGYVGKTAIAPFLWYASFNDSKNFAQTIDISGWKGNSVRMTASGGSRSTSALCCATNSSAKVTINTARLEVVR